MDEITTYISGLQQTLDRLPQKQIAQVIDILQQARLEDRQVFIMGNGGSAATASHFVCDLAKNTRKKGWPLFRIIGLTDNMPNFLPMPMTRDLKTSSCSSSPAWSVPTTS